MRSWAAIMLGILATVACSVACAGMCDAQEAGGSGYVIAGTVVNAVTGAALVGARVSLAETRDRRRAVEVLTSEDGRFSFAGLPAGKFALDGAKSGYIPGGYEQHEQYSTAIVTGPEYATDKLVLKLMPTATIAGRVLDEAGEPVRDARVEIFREDHSGGMDRVSPVTTANSDDRGYFDAGGLRPGTFYVAVTATPWYAVHAQAGSDSGGAPNIPASLDVAYPMTFYGGATDAEGAAPIALKGGERQDIDLRLSPVAALRLLFHVPVDENGQPGPFSMPLLLKQVFDTPVQANPGGFQPVAPGVWEVTGIPAGHYDVRLQGTQSGQAPQFSEIDLERSGQDLSEVKGEPLGTLHVTLTMAEDEMLPANCVVGLRDARQRVVAFFPADEKGEVMFGTLKAGRYEIVVGSPDGKQYAVTQMTAGGKTTSGNGVDVGPGAVVNATAEVAMGVVRVEGTAVKNGKPVAGVMVALVPNDPGTHVDLFRRDQSDFDGTFNLLGVVPGTYTLVAVEDAWGFAWMKPGVLARYVQHGQQVIVGEKMRGAVHVPEAVEVQVR